MPPNKNHPVRPSRQLFHTTGGNIDFSRLIEQLIPTAIIGVLVIYANSKVTEYQISELRQTATRQESNDKDNKVWLQQQAEKLAGISAQMAGFLAQQTQLNAAMDARLTYIERSIQTGGSRVTVIEPAVSSSPSQQAPAAIRRR